MSLCSGMSTMIPYLLNHNLNLGKQFQKGKQKRYLGLSIRQNSLLIGLIALKNLLLAVASKYFRILSKTLKTGKNLIARKMNYFKSKLEQTISILFYQQKSNMLLSFGRLRREGYSHQFAIFFIFFQNLIKAIIPDDGMSIQDCYKKQLLCINITDLQKLSYQVMQNIEKLCLFMNRPEFNSEKILTFQFFEYYQWFTENLCSIKKKDIGKVPKLLQYINLSNPIQISRRKIVQQEVNKVKIRKKSNTVGSKPQRKRKSEDFVKFNYVNIYKEFNGYIYRTKRFNKSCDSKICNKKQKYNDQPSYKIPSIFKFKPEIHKNYPVQICRKRKTISTQDYIPSLSSLMPMNMRSESIQYSNMAKTQFLQSQCQQSKLTRCNTISIPNAASELITAQTSICMIKGQKKRKKKQKLIDVLISGKDEQIERNELKMQVESFDAFMTKSQVMYQNKNQQASKKICLSKGSKNNSKISQQQQIKMIQNKLANFLKKY